MEAFDKTISVCPVCLKKIEAVKVEKNGNIYLDKTCDEHGSFSTLIWEDDKESYLKWGEDQKIDKEKIYHCFDNCGLCDNHSSGGCCVVLELTKRCNLRCPVCFASAGESSEDDLTLDEIEKIYDMLLEKGGPFNVQLSGGEPTMRDDLDKIIKMGQEKGFHFFQLNSNGVRIAKEEGYADYLRQIGVSCVFLQFDGLRSSDYVTMRGTDLLETKLKCLDNLADAGIPVNLVPTIAKGVNDDELGDIIRFALANMPYIKGVHFQPASNFGRNMLSYDSYRLTIPKLTKLIDEQTGGTIKATDFRGGSAENAYCSFHASYLNNDNELILLNRKTSGCIDASYSREFVQKKWGVLIPRKDACNCEPIVKEQSLDDFINKVRLNTFVLSCMLFMDSYNFDLERVNKCYISEIDKLRGMVPFCAYNLTDTNGTSIFRK